MARRAPMADMTGRESIASCITLVVVGDRLGFWRGGRSRRLVLAACGERDGERHGSGQAESSGNAHIGLLVDGGFLREKTLENPRRVRDLAARIIRSPPGGVNLVQTKRPAHGRPFPAPEVAITS